MVVNMRSNAQVLCGARGGMQGDPSPRVSPPLLPCARPGGAGGRSRGRGEGGCSSSGTPERCSGQGGGPGLAGCLPGAVPRPPAALRGREQFADFACTAPGTSQTDPQPDPDPHPGCATTGSRDPRVCLSPCIVHMVGTRLVLHPFALGSPPSLPSASGTGGAGGRWVPARGSQVPAAMAPLPPVPGMAPLPTSPGPRRGCTAGGCGTPLCLLWGQGRGPGEVLTCSHHQRPAPRPPP